MLFFSAMSSLPLGLELSRCSPRSRTPAPLRLVAEYTPILLPLGREHFPQFAQPCAPAPTNSFARGDWNGDSLIDGADLAIWQRNYNPIGYLFLDGTLAASSTGNPDDLQLFYSCADFAGLPNANLAASVPGPASLLLLSTGLLSLGCAPLRSLPYASVLSSSPYRSCPRLRTS